MAYFVRKITRSKWEFPDKKEKIISSLQADAIANDLRTTGNTLSFWRAESLEWSDMEPIVLVNSLLGDNFGTIRLLCVPEEYLNNSGFEIKQNENGADTVIKEYRHLHYDLVNLDVNAHLKFATEIVLKILLNPELSGDEKKQNALVRRYPKKELIDLAKKWLDAGKFSYEDLEEKEQRKKGHLIETLQNM